jgi:hypothetical protein
MAAAAAAAMAEADDGRIKTTLQNLQRHPTPKEKQNERELYSRSISHVHFLVRLRRGTFGILLHAVTNFCPH